MSMQKAYHRYRADLLPLRLATWSMMGRSSGKHKMIPSKEDLLHYLRAWKQQRTQHTTPQTSTGTLPSQAVTRSRCRPIIQNFIHIPSRVEITMHFLIAALPLQAASSRKVETPVYVRLLHTMPVFISPLPSILSTPYIQVTGS